MAACAADRSSHLNAECSSIGFMHKLLGQTGHSHVGALLITQQSRDLRPGEAVHLLREIIIAAVVAVFVLMDGLGTHSESRRRDNCSLECGILR